ncbi:unnamed protein product [Durusdinium trenchii]|uniref:Uncharacterized protein n=1 Tax=Durusdinium trenchii TaxID=1381693 RepID=A0ABP0LPV9_9DINO
MVPVHRVRGQEVREGGRREPEGRRTGSPTEVMEVDSNTEEEEDPKSGASQHAQLQLLLSQRSAADKAYAQALVRMPEQEGDVASERNFHLQPWAYRLRFTCQCSPLSGRGAPPRTYTCASG